MKAWNSAFFCCSSIDQYYVGATHQEFDKRHKNHRSGKYTKSFTSKANDWIEFFVISLTYPIPNALQRQIHPRLLIQQKRYFRSRIDKYFNKESPSHRYNAHR